MVPTRPAPTAHRRHGRARRLGASVLLVGLFATALVTVDGALAANATRGVDYVDFDSRPDACFEDQPIPCLPGAGTGRSNTIYVHQTEVGGHHRYRELSGTGDDGGVWIQTTLSGECAAGHRLSTLEIGDGHQGDHAGQYLEAYGSLPGFPIPQPVNPDNRTVPNRNVAVHVPVQQVVDSLLFSSPVDLLAWGEQRIAQRVADGESETNARIEPYHHTTSAGLHATLICRRRANDRHPYATDSAWHTVDIVWLGVGMEPGEETDDGWRDALLPDDPHAPPPIEPNLSVGFQVTQAHLSAISDPDDACLLHLSAAFTTTEPGEVSYRFVDELGHHSQTFRVAVDQTRTALVDHRVALEPAVIDPAAASSPPDDLAVEDDAGIGGLAQEAGDNVRGYFLVEVVEPHTTWSGIASYNVDGCVTTADDGGSLTNPTAPVPPDLVAPAPPPIPPLPPPAPDDLAVPPAPDPRPTPPPVAATALAVP